MEAVSEATLPPLTGSPILDPWRIRLRLHLRGELTVEPRRSGATRSEQLLWEALDALGVGWCREYASGKYRLDFYLPSAGLAVEVDGGSHYGRRARGHDELRDAWHRVRGIRTLRVSDREVLDDLKGVMYLISRELEVRRQLADLGESSPALGNEVAVLVDAAEIVEAEILRIAAACETVLPQWSTPPLLGRLLARAGLR
jgi:very-short-patch-repair endonuclease